MGGDMSAEGGQQYFAGQNVAQNVAQDGKGKFLTNPSGSDRCSDVEGEVTRPAARKDSIPQPGAGLVTSPSTFPNVGCSLESASR